jgi:hypothetical protein
MPPDHQLEGHYVEASVGSIDLIFLWLIGGDLRKVLVQEYKPGGEDG